MVYEIEEGKEIKDNKINKKLIGDLSEEGAMCLVSKGGKGGLGNKKH